MNAPATAIGWAPHPGPQTAFLASNVTELLYGGAAGGGKSDALLVGALRLVNEPSYRAVLFRRTFPELEDSLIDRAWSYYPALGGTYNQNKHRWTFPSGAQINLRSMQHEADRFDFKSAEFQYIAFDELTSFTESQYRYLFSRLRSSKGLPCVMRAGTNPGGAGHDWVLRRWAPWLYPNPAIDPDRARPEEYAGPFELPGIRLHYRHDQANDVEELVPSGTPGSYSRSFIPATVYDNPSIIENDPDYLIRLGALDRVERARLLGGDWMIRGAAGEWFDRSWFDVVPRGPGPLAVARVRYWDRAATEAEKTSSQTAADQGPDWTAGVLMSRDVHGFCYVEDVVRFRGPPHVVEKRIADTARRDRRDYGEVVQCLEQDPGQAGKFEVSHYVRKTLAGYNVRVRRPQGNKVKRAKPFSAQAEQGTIRLVRGPWNTAYLDELELFPEGKKDQVDGSSGAYSQVVAGDARTMTTGTNPYSATPGGF